MSWIKVIAESEASGKLKKLYDRIRGKDGHLDHIMMAHSLRPHSMEGHMALYKYVLHHTNNTIPKWFLEALGVYTSLLNNCMYCVEHHFAGMLRLLNDEEKAQGIRKAFEADKISSVFELKEAEAFAYAKLLSVAPSEVSEADIEKLRALGWTDGEILEINQVTAYFHYANRTVLGLGVTLENKNVGLSPDDSSDPNNWTHQ
ncbi:MAG: putative peroxidase-related enzyme [Limisphaerales bacterium]|jgi:uncharacterized peroxidase-related enzyme